MNKLTPTGINHRRQRQYNRGLIFQLLATESGMSRSELANHSGLTKMTLSNIISDFLDQGLVVESTDNGNPASPSNPAKLSISPTAPKVVGVIIHRTNVSAALCDLNLNILRTRRVPMHTFDEAFLMNTAIELTDEMVAGENILGIGISTVGPVDIEHGILLNPPDFCGLRNIHVLKYFEKYDLPVFLNHHLNCDALAERYYGNGRRFHDFIFLTVDKGINLGIVTGNQIYCNNTGYSSEIGRVLVNYNPVLKTPFLGGLGDVVDLTMVRDDPRRKSYMVDILAAVMSGICDILNPQAIILGGEEGNLSAEHYRQFDETLNSRIVLHDYRRIEVLRAFRDRTLEASSSAVSVIQRVFNGQLLV